MLWSPSDLTSQPPPASRAARPIAPAIARRASRSRRRGDVLAAIAALLVLGATIWAALSGAYSSAVLAALAAVAIGFIHRHARLMADRLAAMQIHLDQAAVAVDATRLEQTAQETEFARRVAEDRYRSLICALSDVLAIADRDGTILYANPSAERMIGFRPDELSGNDALGLVHPEDAARARAVFAVTPPPAQPVEIRVRRRPGHWRAVEIGLATLPTALSATHSRMTVVVLRDVAERKATETRISEEAFQDRLTGLPNRTVLLDRLRTGLAQAARRPDHEIALLLLDLDRFKAVNDRFGHARADEILTAVSRRLTATLRAGDTAARLSGDEFGVVLGDVQNGAEAIAIAARIGEELRKPYPIAGREVTLSASVGIAVSRPGQHNEIDLLREAESALDRAMRTGGAALFDPVRGGAALQRLELEAELRRAIDAGDLEVHYLPAVDLRTGAIAVMEALVRWRHATRGLLPPSEFLGIAESTGLICPLGQVVLRDACRHAAAWRARYGPGAPAVGINLSAGQLASRMIVAEVAAALRESGLDPGALTLEVAGALGIGEAADLRQTLDQLRSLGVRLAADDAGSGFATLGNLTLLPVDELKIDREFIRTLGRDPEDAAIVEAVTHLAHVRRMRVTAEGLESEELVNRVRDLGVDLGQGTYFSGALPLDQALLLLDQQVGIETPSLEQVAG